MVEHNHNYNDDGYYYHIAKTRDASFLPSWNGKHDDGAERMYEPVS